MCDVPRIVPPRSFASPRFLAVVEGGEWDGWVKVLPGEFAQRRAEIPELSVGSGMSGDHEKSTSPGRAAGEVATCSVDAINPAGCGSDIPVPTSGREQGGGVASSALSSREGQGDPTLDPYGNKDDWWLAYWAAYWTTRRRAEIVEEG